MLILVLSCKSEAKHFNTKRNGVAVQGYDVVAYFEKGKATAGNPTHSWKWKGAIWQFSNAKHLNRFKKSPKTYAPQYGGYCAWAVSRNYTADIDPHAWKIVQGKLYLNYNTSIQKRWEKQTRKHIERADKNWPGLRSKL